MEAFLKDNASSSVADRAYYLCGLARYRLGTLPQRQAAREDFAKALAKTKDSVVRANSHTALGDIAWEAGDMGEAEKMYRQALAYCEQDAPPADHAYYRLGCVLQRLGRWLDADGQFNRVVKFFPDSEFGARAGRRVHARRWTIQAAAYRAKKPAETFAETLRRQNLPAVCRVHLRGQEPLFVVEVGRYRTFEQAAAMLANVRQHERGAFITVTN
jgi:tetratricopeptide (TPR) repeat protein